VFVEQSCSVTCAPGEGGSSRWYLTKESGQRPTCPLAHFPGLECVPCRQMQEQVPEDCAGGAHVVLIWNRSLWGQRPEFVSAIGMLTELSLCMVITRLRPFANRLSRVDSGNTELRYMLIWGGFVPGTECVCRYGQEWICDACIQRERSPKAWVIQDDQRVWCSRKEHPWFYGSTDAAHCRSVHTE
jgi:hypothetical protein